MRRRSPLHTPARSELSTTPRELVHRPSLVSIRHAQSDRSSLNLSMPHDEMTIEDAVDRLMQDPVDRSTALLPPSDKLWNISAATQYVFNGFFDHKGSRLEGFHPTSGGSDCDALTRVILGSHIDT